MSKKQKYTLAIIVVVILLVIFLYYYFKPKKETCPDGSAIPASGNCTQVLGSTVVAKPDSSGCVQPSSYTDATFPIGLGMRGNLVIQLQDYMNSNYKANLVSDGYFGCLTQAAVKKNFNSDTISQVVFNNVIQGLAASVSPST